MKKITVYSLTYCPYCKSAKKLLDSKGLKYEEIIVSEDDDETWDRLEKETGFKTMPQIFIGEQFIGGYTDLAALDKSGKLEELAKG